jgi:hypothetical protein
VRLAAAEDHVLDLRRGELRHLAQDVPDAVGGQVVRSRQVERPAMGLGQGRPAAGDHDGFSQARFSSEWDDVILRPMDMEWGSS